MGNPKTILGAVLVVLLAGCGRAPEDAAQTVKHSVATLNAVQRALAFVGLWPSYECGAPRRETAARLAARAQERFACAQVSTEHDDVSDTVVVAFPGGCVVDGKALDGVARLRVSGGDDRHDVAFDLSGLTVDDAVVPLVVRYGQCGDSHAVRVAGAGTLSPGTDFAVDVTVTLYQGPWLFGHTTAVVDGFGELDTAAGVVALRFDGVVFEVGGALPQAGTVELDTADGHSMTARFADGWPVGEVTLSIDGGGEVPVPL